MVELIERDPIEDEFFTRLAQSGVRCSVRGSAR